SFQSNQKHLFFGRDTEARELFHLVSVEKTVVLFAKSGIGKTSLLNAGVIPNLMEKCIVPVPVRFGTDAFRPEQHASISLDEAMQRFQGVAEPKGRDTSDQESLWAQLKRQRFEKEGKTYVPLLVFDQFEELFTLYTEKDKRRRMITELADLIQERLPEAQREYLLDQLDAGQLTPAELAAAEKAPDVKFVFSIRSDMLHFMDELSEEIPYILRSRYQLFGLNDEQARDAIVKPAALTAAGFTTPPFGYSEEALREMLAKLSKNREVESFQLQLVCQALEEKLAKGQLQKFDPVELMPRSPQGLPLVTPDFYGGPDGLEDIIEASYRRRLEELDEKDYQPARLLLEDALINENGRRRSVDVTDLLVRPGVSTDLLDTLETKRLVRKEPRLESYYYEISHDTLLGPIGKFKKERLEEEEKQKLAAEAERQKAEQAKINRRRRVNALLGLLGAVLLGIALVATWSAQKEQQKAEVEKKNATIAIQKADSLHHVAQQALDTADLRKSQADESALVAKTARGLAEIRKSEADVATARAAAEQKKSKEAFQKLDVEKAKLAKLYLNQAYNYIYQLDYEKAYPWMMDAVKLDVEKKMVSDSLLEMAFWYTETGNLPRAWGILDTAYALTGKKPEKGRGDRQAALNAIELKSKTKWDSLQVRYYPKMITIQGGTDVIGSGQYDDEPLFEVTISTFKMAETETTWWQYGLYCAVTNQKLPGGALNWGGATPVVNVDWYDAVAYANWLSEHQKGFEPIISGEEDDRKIEKGPGYRLPTEAEWEYAARAGTDSTYAGCDTEEDLFNFAWFDENSGGSSRRVKTKKPNAWGLHDMSGNVWEWCWDWYADYPENKPEINYLGAPEGSDRVDRGGGWIGHAGGCRVAGRYSFNPEYSNDYIGFRVVFSPQ
ncbi:MAG: SUMF1/EgtB/PvdO family nonheme iron enzyme, partial [Saprospiraceae bacterium]|nr:SUMF1/EgtB/PvdO family nonheme iron enzyme [Saprospiraceae bacterium]